MRTHDRDRAGRLARGAIAGGLELIEITFTVPDAPALVAELLAERRGDGPPWIGMGTVTSLQRVERAAAAGAEFIVSPNASPAVARAASTAGLFLVIGALTPTEIVAARELGADLVKVYPLAPVGGPRYLETVRQPLGDIPMLAAGGYPPEEIPAYRAAGASGFGIAVQLMGGPDGADTDGFERALRLARGEELS